MPVANDMEHDKVQVDENSRETKFNHDVVIKLSRETLGRGNRQLKAFVLLKYFVTDSARCSYDLHALSLTLKLDPLVSPFII